MLFSKPTKFTVVVSEAEQLFASWTSLAFLLISEELELFHLPEALTYASGFSLAFLHVYNKKYCQCDDGTCCDN